MAAVYDQIDRRLVSDTVDDSMDVTPEYGPMSTEDDIEIDINMAPEREEDDPMAEADHHSDVEIEDIQDAEDAQDDLMAEDELHTDHVDDFDSFEPISSDFHIGDATSPEAVNSETVIIKATDYLETPFSALDRDGEDPSEVVWDESTADYPSELALELGAHPPQGDGAVPSKTSLEGDFILNTEEQAVIEEKSDRPLSEQEHLSERRSLIVHEDVTGKTDQSNGASSSAEVNAHSSQRESQVVQPTSNHCDDVRVFYKSNVYFLIPSADNDDPSSYFFKDSNITGESLPNFFAGLRGVLHDDLSTEEELCLVFDDLAIEISETTASLYDFTFIQMVELRTLLLSNEGVSKPDPMYVSLSTKLNVENRVSSLFESASAGKGLSEVAYWDSVEGSEDESSAVIGQYDEQEHESQNQNPAGENSPVDRDGFTGAGVHNGDVATDAVTYNQKTSANDQEHMPPSDDYVDDEHVGEITTEEPTLHHNGIDSVEDTDPADDILDYSEDEANDEEQAGKNNADDEKAANTGEEDEQQGALLESTVLEADLHDKLEEFADSPHEDAVHSLTNATEATSTKVSEDEKAVVASLEAVSQDDEIDFGVETFNEPELQDADDDTAKSEVDTADDEVLIIDVGSNTSEPTVTGDDALLVNATDDGEDEIGYDDDDKANAFTGTFENTSGKRPYLDGDDDFSISEQDSKRQRS